jgi:outer membrane protein assembly factor BamC
MNASRITVLTLAIVALAACSTPARQDGKSFDYKAFNGDDRFGIPGESEAGTSFSEFSKGGSNRKAANVLPPVKNVRLEQKDNQRWLVVNDTAENIWPLVKAFWLENGLVIKTENAQAGIIETDWAENRAKIQQDAVNKFFGGFFDSFYSSGERDQYHTRLQRSKDAGATEIYITHSGLHEVLEGNGLGYRWLSRPRDLELEATMLQLLMSKLGGGSGVLTGNKKSTDNGLNGEATAPKINKLTDGSQSIFLSDPFDKSWRKVGLALEQAGHVLADKDRNKGIYFLSAGKEDTKLKPGSEKIDRLQVKVRELTSGCEITVSNTAGVSNSETQKIVDSLLKALGRI